MSIALDQDVRDIRLALRNLREARELLKAAGASKTVARVRLAITSAGGALRNAEGRRFKR